jgi:uncharacterized protein YndB with AHSA1/START domain
MRCVFDAPRKLVWEAMSKPDLLKRWLPGPPSWSMVGCEVDLRVGGTYRFVWRGPVGTEMAMRGVYRQLVAPERVVRTESFVFGGEALPGESLVTLIISEQGDRTTLTLTVLFPSKEARDAAIASGMERGLAEGYDRLAELFASTMALEALQGGA